jgi:hypothetical protein
MLPEFTSGLGVLKAMTCPDGILRARSIDVGSN